MEYHPRSDRADELMDGFMIRDIASRIDDSFMKVPFDIAI